MALFPTDIPIGFDTQLTPNAGKKLETAEDGTIIVINLYSQPTYQGRIVIPWANAAQRSTVEAFWDANKNTVWSFEHPGDGATYNLYFLNKPLEERLETFGDTRFKITIDVAGTR